MVRQRKRLSVLWTRCEQPHDVVASADALWLALARHTLPDWSVYSKMSFTLAVHRGFPKGPAPATQPSGWKARPTTTKCVHPVTRIIQVGVSKLARVNGASAPAAFGALDTL